MPAIKGADKPFAFRAKADTMAKVREIAKVNGISIADVLNLAIPAGLNIVETKFAEMRDIPAASTAAAKGGDQ